jgi:glucosamine--fructose-6-phosphate aminotransferase (isomerizing)
MELELKLEEIELGGFPNFMLKEIFEQPEALRNTLSGRFDAARGEIILGGLQTIGRDLVKARRLVLTGQGTAWHAALVIEYLIEEFARIPCEVQYASEFRYRNPIVEEGTILVAISQSGETADTLAALEEARERGAMTLGVVNVVGSSIARVTDAGVYLRVGPEIGVASTKAFVGQVAVGALMAIYAGRRRHLSMEATRDLLRELDDIPEKIRAVTAQSHAIKALVEKLVDRENWLFLGRGYNYPVALEGALKVKEISYIHAEGMPAAEMKHGPIALIHDGMPCVFVAPKGSQHDKVIGNMQEVRARGGRVIAIATEGDEDILPHADDIIRVPACPEALSPLLTTVALQLMAYHAAVLRGHDVDKPRNLAKSVTVE